MSRASCQLTMTDYDSPVTPAGRGGSREAETPLLQQGGRGGSADVLFSVGPEGAMPEAMAQDLGVRDSPS